MAQRLADGYIDVKGLCLTLWQAAWRTLPFTCMAA
ncbi:acyl-CoA dehydrogenase FadE [Mycobacteroides abscessus subsp. abscessus]|nr:acyl-CoA dehydrogenase FadE [Mycobacteroides abscessus subsp. abscessus]